ncbi:MAG: hydantoinase B/oxoprolinase family protein [Chloroflexi bacterium]|nr:hydantoinase B/oxoprolinase family protein [Chloroflexota bacterium]
MPEAIDPVTFEILRHRLWAINDEAGAAIKRVAGSAVARGGDFNTGIINATGDMVLMGIYIASHAAVQDRLVQFLLREYQDNPGIGQDDMFMTNDPFYGALHQSDVTLVAPIHHQGDLVAWCGATLHHADVGGPTPGGFAVGARSVFDEPPLMPPIKVVERGTLRKDIELEFVRRSRLPELVALDLRAQIAACNITKARLRSLIVQWGVPVVQEVMQGLLAYVEKRFRARLRELPDGAWSHTSFIEHDGVSSKVYPVVLTLTKEAERLIFDFTESADQAGASINCCLSGLRGAVMAATLPLLCFEMPWAPGGLWPAIEIRTRSGSVVDAQWPAGVSASTVSAGWAARTAANVCLGRMMVASPKYRDHAMAAWSGSFQGQSMFGTNEKGERFSAYIGFIGSGTGARTYKDGIDCGGRLSSMVGVIWNVEDYEYAYPLLHLFKQVRPDSGGAGTFRGGVSEEVAFIPYRATSTLDLSIFGWGVDVPASSGIYGGYPGGAYQSLVVRRANARQLLVSGRIPQQVEAITGDLEMLPPLARANLGSQDLVVFRSAGGGGFGDPLDRDPALVARDLEARLVSPQAARDIYGVLLDSHGHLDLEATAVQRTALRRERSASAILGAGSSQPAQPDGPAVVAPFTEYLMLGKRGDHVVTFCRRCGHVFGPAQENYKRHALMAEYPLSRGGPVFASLDAGSQFVFREYCCPGCATLLEAEVNLRGSPPRWDVRLAPRTPTPS